ncbi:DUF3303 domain-containing protein [Microvirga terrae]|uniref:DUF3303 domain-containing protein n=1 Tax=Microvirga terrae TaxID=2740529 RepID=A0ABY5RKP6_9HYPH|nr:MULTISPECIES: DUF3303 family protein [Microvirga]MBQ0819020.1 DUF3303 family protein [Microvirga sp. HBU67558]UVF17793.1 DUF3303 domain-containing protein [Microvirga terrae]
MLYVIMGKAKAAGTMKERVARRVAWQYPPGIRVKAEYWLMSGEPALVAIAEADDPAPIMMGIAAWDDFLDLTVVPALTAEQGLELARRMQPGG